MMDIINVLFIYPKYPADSCNVTNSAIYPKYPADSFFCHKLCNPWESFSGEILRFAYFSCKNLIFLQKSQ